MTDHADQQHLQDVVERALYEAEQLGYIEMGTSRVAAARVISARLGDGYEPADVEPAARVVGLVATICVCALATLAVMAATIWAARHIIQWAA